MNKVSLFLALILSTSSLISASELKRVTDKNKTWATHYKVLGYDNDGCIHRVFFNGFFDFYHPKHYGSNNNFSWYGAVNTYDMARNMRRAVAYVNLSKDKPSDFEGWKYLKGHPVVVEQFYTCKNGEEYSTGPLFGVGTKFPFKNLK